MKSGKCPKCRSTNVHDGSVVPHKKGASSQYALKISAFYAVALDRYVCAGCGYVESYVTDRSDLERISQEWPRVGSEKRS